MSRKRHQRSRRRKKRKGFRFAWLIVIVGGIVLGYYVFNSFPEQLAKIELPADESPTPSFTPTPYPTPIAPVISGDAPDLDVLAAYMLELINVDRVAHGL